MALYFAIKLLPFLSLRLLTDIIDTAQNLVLMLSNNARANVRAVRQGNGDAAAEQEAQSVRLQQKQL